VVRAALLLTLAIWLMAASCTEQTGARVVEVFDGDSFAVEGDQVRMLGINAPEAGECYGDEARDRLSALIEGRDVQLTALDERDRFDRLLAYVTVDRHDVAETLLGDGMAIAVQSEHDRNAAYVDAAARAAADGRGLWSPDACGTPTGADVSIDQIAYDPAGPDGEALNGEYVEIVNTSDAAVDLGGWTLRDESSSNRLALDRSIGAGERLTVRTGCGDDTADIAYWCSELPVWSNAGDTAFLLDPNGNIVTWKSYP
jgi:endonuclease YncB( thermonuclease family)